MKALLAVLVIVLGAAAAWLWQGRHSEHTRDERKQVPVQQGGVPKAIDARPAMTREADPLPVPETMTSPESSTSRNPGAGSAAPEYQRALMQDKGYVNASRKLHGLMTSARHPDIARVLELDPATADRLLAVLAEHRMKEVGLNRRGVRERLQPEDLELKLQQREFEEKSEIAAVIGRSKMPQFEAYQESLFERFQVRNLQFELMNSPDPLDFEDSETVIAAMHEARVKVESEMEATQGITVEKSDHPFYFISDGKRVARPTAGADPRIFDAAARHLSPAQAQAFRRSLDSEAEFTRVGEELERIKDEVRSRVPEKD